MATKAELAVSAEKPRGQFGAKTMMNDAEVVRRQKLYRKKRQCPEGAGKLVSREGSTG